MATNELGSKTTDQVWNSIKKQYVTIRKNHVHKWRGKSFTIFGWRKRIIICTECSRKLGK